MTIRTIKVGSKIDLESHDLTRSYFVRGVGIVTAVSLTTVIVRTPGNSYLHAPWSSVMHGTRYRFDAGRLIATSARRTKEQAK